MFLSRYLATQRPASHVSARHEKDRRSFTLAEMSETEKLKTLVNARLTVAAEEIFSIFEQTIQEYEKTVIRLRQEIDQQQRLAGWKGKGTQVNSNLQTALTLMVLTPLY